MWSLSGSVRAMCKRALCVRLLATQAAVARKTCLYDVHEAHRGRMVEFAGYLLPVQYGTEGIADSHKHTREHCSVFDVSHMMQTEIRGKDKVEFLEGLVVSDLQEVQSNHSTLSLITNEHGGIVDDLVVTKTALGYMYMVSNAATREKVQNLLIQRLEDFRGRNKDVSIKFLDERALLAVQGPEAAKVLQPLVDVDLKYLYFMSSTLTNVCGYPACRVTRCGYTGEDGFEISLLADRAATVMEELLASKQGNVKPAGLGARDSLRLEAGLCLYGRDIDESTSPVEASLSWTIGKRRRQQADFPGADIILSQLRDKPRRRRVGLVSYGPPARAETPIHEEEGEQQIGYVTSGCPAPSLGCNVSMGYVTLEYSKLQTQLQLNVRKKFVDARVTKMPFIPTKYYVQSKK